MKKKEKKCRPFCCCKLSIRVVSYTDIDMNMIVPLSVVLVGRSPTSAGERSGNKPIPGFVPCCNVRCSIIRLKCG